MTPLPPLQAQALAALSRVTRVTLRHQTGRMQAAYRALIARGLAEVDPDGVVTRVDTSCVDMIDWS